MDACYHWWQQPLPLPAAKYVNGHQNQNSLPPVNWRWVEEGDGYVGRLQPPGQPLGVGLPSGLQCLVPYPYRRPPVRVHCSKQKRSRWWRQTSLGDVGLVYITAVITKQVWPSATIQPRPDHHSSMMSQQAAGITSPELPQNR
jgi:hypothetical protein